MCVIVCVIYSYSYLFVAMFVGPNRASWNSKVPLNYTCTKCTCACQYVLHVYMCTCVDRLSVCYSVCLVIVICGLLPCLLVPIVPAGIVRFL